jgi:hypothetical protein
VVTWRLPHRIATGPLFSDRYHSAADQE